MKTKTDSENRNAIRIRLQDSESNVYVWTIRRIVRTHLMNPDGPLSRSRYGSGWEYEDHEGYRRFQEGTWRDVVPRVKLTAENYGFTLCSELS